MKHASALLVAAVVLLSGCSSGPDHQAAPSPGSTVDLSGIRGTSWTVTAGQIAKDDSAEIRTIGDFETFESISAGSIVVSAAETSRMLTVAGLSAQSGEIKWRRQLPLSSQYGSQCVDDDGGPVVACMVDAKDGSAVLTVIDEKTGAVRSTTAMPKALTFTVRGDDLYTAEFDASSVDRTGVLNAVIQSSSLSTTEERWRTTIEIPLKNWGHDGGESIEVGAKRVVAGSGPIEVVVDKASGKELSKPTSSTDGYPTTAFETPLAHGGWVRSRQLMPSESGGKQTDELYSPNGALLATRTSGGSAPAEEDAPLVIVGDQLRSASSGRKVFSARSGDHLLASFGSGTYVLTARGDSRRVTVWNGKTGHQRGGFEAPGHLGGYHWLLANRSAALMLVQVDSGDEPGPFVLEVVNLKRPAITSTIKLPGKLGKTQGFFGTPTLALTRVGVAVTGPDSVVGLVG